MIAVGAYQEDASKLISELDLKDEVGIAATNSSQSVTISGDNHGVQKLLSEFETDGTFARKLKTEGVAYHSHHMRTVGEDYMHLLSTQMPHGSISSSTSAQVPMVSSLSGQFTDLDSTSTATYWCKNLESPVQFEKAIGTLIADRKYHFIEIGPHSVLEMPLRQIKGDLRLPDNEFSYSHTLTRQKDSTTSMFELVGSLYLHGHDMNFERINLSSRLSASPNTQVLPSLPTYHWHYGPPLCNESRQSAEFRNRQHLRHDLLGAREPGGDPRSYLWRNILNIKDVPWLEDHTVGGTLVLPGACYLAIAVEALKQALGSTFQSRSVVTMRRVKFSQMLSIPGEEEGIEIYTSLKPLEISSVSISQNWWQFSITSYSEGASNVHARGLISIDDVVQPLLQNQVDLSSSGWDVQDSTTWYSRMAEEGLGFGPAFRSLAEVCNDKLKMTTEIISRTNWSHARKFEAQKPSEYMIHPITLDAVFQTLIIANSAGSRNDLLGKIPTSIDCAKISTKGPLDDSSLCTIRAMSRRAGPSTIFGHADILDKNEAIIASFADVRMIPVITNSPGRDVSKERAPILRVLWKPDISRLPLGQNAIFSSYTDHFAHSHAIDLAEDDGRLAGALDLLAHESPYLNILALQDENHTNIAAFLRTLGADTGLKRFASYTTATINERDELYGRRLHSVLELDDEDYRAHVFGHEIKFDVVLVPNVSINHFHRLNCDDDVFAVEIFPVLPQEPFRDDPETRSQARHFAICQRAFR